MNYMDVLSIVLPVLAFVCVLLLLFINIYSKLRPNQFVNVNCWFCNQWTKIPKEFWNSWDCPFCEQYNGFTSDGGYNKLIPAQHDELMNKLPLNVPITANKYLDNGLCSTCNNNQQLKIQQLAMFSPIDDNNFDEEVEIYKEQLERAYKLCSPCESVLKRTLQKNKSLLLGIRLKTLKQQGLNYFNSKKRSYHIFTKTAIKKKLLTTIRYITIILATIRLYEVAKNVEFSRELLNQSLPSFLLPYVQVTIDSIIFIYNLVCSIFVYINYLQGIVGNCFAAINALLKNINITLDLPEYLFVNTYVFYNFLNQTFVGFVLQFLCLILLNTKRKISDYIKFVAWLVLLYLNNFTALNMTAKIFEVSLYALIIILPSTKQQKIKMKTKKSTKPMKEKSELLNEKANLSPEIFPNEKQNNTNKTIFGCSLNNSPNSMKLFSAQSSDNADHLFHIFGSRPVFENPLNVSYFKSQNHRTPSSNDSYNSTKNNDLSGSLNSSNYSDNLLNDSFYMENTINKSTEMELNKCLSDLHLSSKSSEKIRSNGELPAAFRISSPLMRPKPVLSPPKLQNVTQSSWVAGGYWKPNEYSNSFNGFTNLSRSSSQSSGFSSQASSQQPFHCDNVFNSLPSSRTNSICGEFDKYSVFSEPAYHYNINSSKPSMQQSRFYPELRSDQQIYICPKPMNIYVQKTPNIRENFCNNVFAVPNPSRDLNTSFSSNYSTCSSFRGNNILRPSSVNSTFYAEPFTRGSLLQKWREQIPNIQNL